MRIITALIDFTPASLLAYKYALWLAKKGGTQLNLLHICASERDDAEQIEKKIADFTGIKDSGVEYSFSIGDGDHIDKIPHLLELSSADFVVIGTHGHRGENPTMLGSDVVQLTQKANIDSLIIQESSGDPRDFSNVLFPIAPHRDFQVKINAVLKLAKMLDFKVNIFCLSDEDGNLNDSIQKNLQLTEDAFEKANLNFSKTIRATKVYSVGYAREIYEEAEAIGSDLIISMAHPSAENSYFGNVDKSNIIMNPTSIPVFTVSNKAEK